MEIKRRSGRGASWAPPRAARIDPIARSRRRRLVKSHRPRRMGERTRGMAP
jgi:hypothetical protein